MVSECFEIGNFAVSNAQSKVPGQQYVDPALALRTLKRSGTIRVVHDLKICVRGKCDQGSTTWVCGTLYPDAGLSVKVSNQNGMATWRMSQQLLQLIEEKRDAFGRRTVTSYHKHLLPGQHASDSYHFRQPSDHTE